MDKNKAMEILKGAILAEIKGRAFYEHTAGQTANEALRGVFATMAAEENGHVEILSKQLRSLARSGQFEAAALTAKPQDCAEGILTPQVLEQIAKAGFETAAITAAMALEEKAVAYYGQGARDAQDPLEKEIYTWLADWEKTHLTLLTDLDRQLQERIWFDNQFWPM